MMSAPPATLHSPLATKGTTVILNEYDIARLHAMLRDGAAPNALHVARTLSNLVAWANANSDGWPYWSKPANASRTAQRTLSDYMVERARGTYDVADLTDAQVKAALSPIKSFLTRQGVDHGVVIP